MNNISRAYIIIINLTLRPTTDKAIYITFDYCPRRAAFQSPRANGAHDFEVGKIPVQPYVAFHSRTEPRWLIVLSCSFLLCLLLALINSVNRVFVLQRTHALHTCSCTSLTQQRINLKPTHIGPINIQHKTIYYVGWPSIFSVLSPPNS